MIVAMLDSASEDQIQHVIDQLVQMGFEVHRWMKWMRWMRWMRWMKWMKWMDD